MSGTGGRGRVLVVDDEPLMLATICAVLDDWARGRDVDLFTADSLAGARTVLEGLDGGVDLVISDLIMPGGNGSELLREVRERWPDTVTMIVSGASDLVEMREAMTAGVFAYLVKPFEPSALVVEAGKAIEVARLRRENRRHEQRLQGELAWAGELQRAMLRPDVPDDPRFTVSVAWQPLPEFQCGGDFYDVLPVSADRRQVLVGDVGGHGIRAALVTAYLKAIAAPVPGAEPPSPAALLESLNRRLCRTLKETPDLLVTFSVIEIDAASRTLVYAGAGHPPVYLLRGGEARGLPSEGPGLGFDPEALYAEQVEDLFPGDRLVLYTDGIREGIPGDPIVSERTFVSLLLDCRVGPDYASDVLVGARHLMPQDAFTDDATVITVLVG